MKPIFRSSMFGFHKEDVAAFIAKQSNQYEKRIADLEAQLENRERAYEIEKQVLASDREELDALREQKNDAASFAEQVKALSEKLSEKYSELMHSCEESALAVDRVQADLNHVNDRLVKSEEYREKAKRFDKLASVLGEIVSGKETQFPVVNEEAEVSHISVNSDGIKEAIEALKALILETQSLSDELSDLVNGLGKKI